MTRRLILMAVGALALGGCGGGSSTDYSGLASGFVSAANAGGVDMTLVRMSTYQKSFVVVTIGDRYYAYDLSSYHAGETYPDYMASSPAVYNKLVAHSNGNCADQYCDKSSVLYWTDPNTGATFETGGSSQKDLVKLAALKQTAQVEISASTLRDQFGLSVERSETVAKLAVQLANTPKKSMTDADYENFSRELLGSSIQDFKQAMTQRAEGNSTAFDSLIAKAASVNGVGPEHAAQIMQGLGFN